MSLIHCPECGKEISDKAESCPNCGYPMVDLDKVKCTTRVQVVHLQAAHLLAVLQVVAAPPHTGLTLTL